MGAASITLPSAFHGCVATPQAEQLSPRTKSTESIDPYQTKRRNCLSKTFDNISDFLNTRMRMSHIYQPVMIIELLESGGEADISEIAKAILVHDPTQIEYYSEITKAMPGRVLTNNHRITRKSGQSYSLVDFDHLSRDEIDELIKICKERLQNFVKDRGDRPWSHRSRSGPYIPSNSKIQILKNSGGRCELCGISAHERFLEVDHIIPRSRGGSNDLSNLQALCYKCNSAKGASDETDFRGILDRYNHRSDGCTHCEPREGAIILQNELAYSILHPEPTVEGLSLVVPKRHHADYFELYQPELNAMHRLLQDRKMAMQESDESVSGFNVRIGVGELAGQAEAHCRVELIPTREQR